MENTLSTEQLLEYIKKQKARIKRLEKETESLKNEREQLKLAQIERSNVTDGSNPAFFWELIEREKPFKRKLAKAALQSLVTVVQCSSHSKTALLRLHNAKGIFFNKWKTYTLQDQLHKSTSQCDELRHCLIQTEQRIGKLKGLLAKTHHANQRNMEEGWVTR